MNTDLMESVGSHVGRHVGVGTIFGEPVRIGDRTVVPVAKLGFGFGSGVGVAAHAEGAASKDEGGGGGGGGGTRPVGVFEISEAGTRFIPVRSRPSPVVLVALGLFLGLGLASLRG